MRHKFLTLMYCIFIYKEIIKTIFHCYCINSVCRLFYTRLLYLISFKYLLSNTSNNIILDQTHEQLKRSISVLIIGIVVGSGYELIIDWACSALLGGSSVGDGPRSTNRLIGVAQGEPMFCRTRLLGLSPQRSIWRKPAALQLPILLWLSNGGLRQCSRTSCRSEHSIALHTILLIAFAFNWKLLQKMNVGYRRRGH